MTTDDLAFRTLTFNVDGKPVSQGSIQKWRGRIVGVTPELRAWRDAIGKAAQAEFGPGWTPLAGPLHTCLEFRLPRPKRHFGTGRNSDRLKDNAPAYPFVKPDADKLERAVNDALTQCGAIADDCLIVHTERLKRYVDTGEQPGVYVYVELHQKYA